MGIPGWQRLVIVLAIAGLTGFIGGAMTALLDLVVWKVFATALVFNMLIVFGTLPWVVEGTTWTALWRERG